MCSTGFSILIHGWRGASSFPAREDFDRRAVGSEISGIDPGRAASRRADQSARSDNTPDVSASLETVQRPDM